MLAFPSTSAHRDRPIPTRFGMDDTKEVVIGQILPNPDHFQFDFIPFRFLGVRRRRHGGQTYRIIQLLSGKEQQRNKVGKTNIPVASLIHTGFCSQKQIRGHPWPELSGLADNVGHSHHTWAARRQLTRPNPCPCGSPSLPIPHPHPLPQCHSWLFLWTV